MTILDYFLVGVAAMGCAGLGLLTGTKGFGRPLLVGIILQACLASLLVWFLPLVVAPLFRVGIGIGWAVLIIHAYAAFSRSSKTLGQFATGLFREMSARTYMQAIAATVFTFVVMLPIHYGDYKFMVDDAIYFGPLVEIFLADYTGGIRVPTYYPALMSAHQLAPTMALAVLAGLLPEVTLVHAVEARYLLMSVFLARVLFLLWRRSGSSDVVFILVVICSIFLIRSELKTLIHTSTYVYALVVAELFLLTLDRRSDAMTFLILALALILMRTSLFYAGASLVGYILLVSAKMRTSPLSIAMILVVLANLVAISLVPKPYGNFELIDVSFSLVNPFSPKPSFDYRQILRFDRIIGQFPELYFMTAGVAVAAILALLKYYYLGFAAIRRLISMGVIAGDKMARRGLELYLLIMLAGWIVVRNSQHGITYQLYNPASIGLIAAMALILVASMRGAWLWRSAIFAVSGTALIVGINIHGIDNIDKVVLGYKFGEPANLSKGTYYKNLKSIPQSAALKKLPNDGASGKLGVRALMLGHRLSAADVSPKQSGVWDFIQAGTENGK